MGSKVPTPPPERNRPSVFPPPPPPKKLEPMEMAVADSVGSLLNAIKDGFAVPYRKAAELDTVRATLFVNFVQRETYGVQIECDESETTNALLLKVLREIAKKLGEETC